MTVPSTQPARPTRLEASRGATQADGAGAVAVGRATVAGTDRTAGAGEGGRSIAGATVSAVADGRGVGGADVGVEADATRSVAVGATRVGDARTARVGVGTSSTLKTRAARAGGASVGANSTIGVGADACGSALHAVDSAAAIAASRTVRAGFTSLTSTH